MKVALALDIGGTATKMGLVSQQGQIHKQLLFETLAHESFNSFLTRFETHYKQLMADYNGSIYALGGGAPNINPRTGFIVSPPNLSWGTVDLKSALARITSLPVYLDNDANMAALAEGCWGEAQKMRDFVVVTLGTGVGTGVIVDGKLLYGADGLAGEGGHIQIVPENGRECGCQGRGHLECYASATGIEKTALEVIGKKYSSKEIAQMFHSGDEGAKKVIRMTTHYLGRGLAAMATLLRPEAFILAGGVAAFGSPFDKMAQEQMDEMIFPTFKGKIPVLFSSVSTTNGALLGGAALVFSHEMLATSHH